MIRLLTVTLLACQAQQPSDLGPSFGGDPGFAAAAHALDAGELPDPGALSEAGLLAGRPIAVGQQPCEARACISARSAWMDEELAVAVGIDGAPVRPPVDLAFVLDASCSVAGSEDVRATPVEIALEALGPDDQLAIWGFTDAVEELLPMGPVDAEEARLVLEGLDRLHELAGVMDELPAAAEDFETMIELLLAQGTHDSGLFDEAELGVDTGLGALDTGDPVDEQALQLLWDLQELADASKHDLLEPGLISLAVELGSAIGPATEVVATTLPDGTSRRASRLVVVSDFDGSSAEEAVVEAADRFVGTSVLGITAAHDRTAMAQLASAPGAHTFDADDPAQALASWERRFDALVAPNAWKLELELDPVSESDWSLARRFGTTDADGRGANAFFASNGHGTLGLVLKPRVEEPRQPRFVLTLTTEDGEEQIGTFARVPVPLLHYPWGQGDDEVALELTRLIRLFDAVQQGDEQAIELWRTGPEALPDASR